MKPSSPCLPMQFYLSIMSLPMLGFLVMFDLVTQRCLRWSSWSEELFRGERLPSLPFPPVGPSGLKS